MGVSKVGFNVADYALRNKMGIGSFRLKDGSSVKVLQNAEKNIIEFFQVKNGKILGAKGYRGPNSDCYAANLLGSLEKDAQSIEELNKAWKDSCNFDVMA